MTKAELQALIERVPDGTNFYVRVADNAWPARARIFKEKDVRGGVVVYFEGVPKMKSHRNFPEGYGAKEIGLAELGSTSGAPSTGSKGK